MTIGAGIVLIALGAILSFAVNIDVDGVDIDMIGYILMGAGALVVIIGLITMMRKRTTESVTHTSVDPIAGERVTSRRVERPDEMI